MSGHWCHGPSGKSEAHQQQGRGAVVDLAVARGDVPADLREPLGRVTSPTNQAGSLPTASCACRTSPLSHSERTSYHQGQLGIMVTPRGGVSGAEGVAALEGEHRPD